MAGGFGDRTPATADPLKDLQQGIALVMAEDEERKSLYERLLRERDQLKAEIVLLEQECRMREENVNRNNVRIEQAKKTIQSLTQMRNEQIRTQRELELAAAKQDLETQEMQKDLKNLHLFIKTSKPAELMDQMRERKAELAAIIEQKERKRENRRQEKMRRRKEKEMQRRQRTNENWSMMSGDPSIGRTDEADDELNVIEEEKNMGMNWSLNDMMQPSLD